jgi:hypothetical protein
MRTAFVILVLWTAVPVFAQRSGTIDSTRDYVALVYDDMAIPDADRGALVTFLASVIPVERWPTVQLTRPTAIDCIIDDFFDYYPGANLARHARLRRFAAIVRYNEQIGQLVNPALLVRLTSVPRPSIIADVRGPETDLRRGDTRAMSEYRRRGAA